MVGQTHVPTLRQEVFLYGITIAGLDEFITQGVLKESYFVWTFAVLMAVTYVLTLTAKAVGAQQDTQFVASVGPVVVTFLTMNVFYVQYFRTCGQSTPLVPPSLGG